MFCTDILRSIIEIVSDRWMYVYPTMRNETAGNVCRKFLPQLVNVNKPETQYTRVTRRQLSAAKYCIQSSSLRGRVHWSCFQRRDSVYRPYKITNRVIAPSTNSAFTV